jgi:MraZ protein
MNIFLGTHQNRRDAKGRVSVPAAFRAALKTPDGSAGLILRPSHNYACIEGWPLAVFNQLGTPMDALDLFSQKHDDMGAILYGEAHQVEPDKEGRVLLPDSMVEFAGLGETVTFIGMRKIFHIWEPAAGAAFLAAARERARAGGILPAVTAAA